MNQTALLNGKIISVNSRNEVLNTYLLKCPIEKKTEDKVEVTMLDGGNCLFKK